MILAVDLGRHAGICVGADRPELEQVDLPQDLGVMMSRFEGAVRGLIRANSPSLLSWERPFLNFTRMDAQGELRTQRLYGQAATMAKLASEYGIAGVCERPVTVRKKIVGSGKADADAIMQFCQAQGVMPQSDHCADAYVMWLYGRTHLRGRDGSRKNGAQSRARGGCGVRNGDVET